MNDHIADANKMVETPRTDAGLEYDETTVDDVKDFARTLERELNAANERIELLTACNSDVARIAKERDDALARIKRLEEAGNAMFIRSTRVGREIWTKAKEAKP